MAFSEISLGKMLNNLSKDVVKNILSTFACKKNPEVEDFLISKSIQHEEKGLAKTILIFDSTASFGIAAYYTISTKSFSMEKMNSTSKKKFFGTSQTNGAIIPSILIGQLGKNDSCHSNITGHELMDFIFHYVYNMSILTPSVITYVEHNGHEKLKSFYEKFDFMYLKRENEELNNNLFCHVIQTKKIIEKINRQL